MFRIVVIFLLVLTWAAGAQGSRKAEFNVDFFCGWDGHYRPMEWTPVEIGISTDLTEPFAGSFVLSAQQDGLNTMNIIHTFVLTPDIPLNLPLVTKLAFGIGNCDLRIRDERGRTRWEYEVDIYGFSPESRLLRVVQEEDLLIGLVGQPQFGLLRLPRETVCVSDRGQGKVCLGPKVPRMTPWDWTGFTSLDVLVVCDPDWSLLRPQQSKAICEWVSNGGTLLVVLGQHPLPQENPLADLIPFHLGEPREVGIPSEALEQWGLDPSQSETVMAWPLFPKSTALLSKTVRAPSAGYLYGLGYVGFGRVAVLGLDPSELSEEQTRHTAKFWTTHIGTCLDERQDKLDLGSGRRPDQMRVSAGRNRAIVLTEDAPEQGTNRPNQNRFRIGIAQNANNQVMEHLYQLRQMRPLSIWWVILTLSALAVLLGPVDYIVLKRLDKLPYTWLTSTGWIVLFTVGAYYGVQELRGGKMQLRAVSVLDGIADSNCAWATYYTGLFAPRSDDYRLAGLGAKQWWSAVAPSREEVWAHQREAGMRQIHCLQADGQNLPVSVPINIWTVQSLLGQGPLDRMPFTANVERRDGRVAVEICNTSDNSLRSGFVLFRDTYINFGPVPAGATRTFDGRPLPFNPWREAGRYERIRGRRNPPPETWIRLDMPQYPNSLGSLIGDAFMAQGCLDRTLAMHACLDLGAALVCAEFEGAPAPFSVEKHSYDVDHIQYARQLVFPKESSKDITHD